MKLGRVAMAFVVLINIFMIGCTGKIQQESADPAIVSETINSEIISLTPNVQKITFYSKSLDKEMKFNIYLPPGYVTTEKYPVLYAYHGYSGNENAWMPDLEMDTTAEELLGSGKIDPLIIVSPLIDNSYGFNSAEAGNYSDYMIHDIIPYVDSHFSTDARKESRYIGGLSMGGWAALYNAFQYPELFSKVGGHSPAVWMTDNWTGSGGMRTWLYPSAEIQKQRDPLLLAASQNLQGLSVYLDCGDEDSYMFYEGAEALNRVLQSRHVPSEYHHSKGGHDGEYWKAQMSNYLLFYSGKT